MPTPNSPALVMVDPGLAELRALQEFMAASLFRPLTARDGMQRRTRDGRSMSKAVAEVIKPNDRLSSFERLEIYNRGYWFRVLDCLYDDFPAVLAILGQRRFHKLITAYLEAHPSESYTLRDLGERFPAFIEMHPEWTAPHTVLAEEAARFEWAQVVAFDGEARPALGVDALLGKDPATLRIGLQPYLSLQALEHPLDLFALSLKRQEEGRSATSNTVAEAPGLREPTRLRRPRPEKVYMAVHRHENMVYFKRLEPAAFAILASLRDGQTLGEACERGVALAKDVTSFGEALQRWFHDWAALGWLCETAEAER